MFAKYNSSLFKSFSHLSAGNFSSFKAAKLNHIFVPCKSKITSEAPNLITLHGVLGSGINFNQVALKDEISSKVNSYLLDLRNHGKAEHKESMSYPEMAADVHRFIIDQNLQDKNNILLGFSMGARLAMEVAVTYPELIKGVTLVDLAPHDYVHDRRFEFVDTMNTMLEKLCQINLNKDKTLIKKDIMAVAFNPEAGEVINSNVIPNENGGYKWRLNMESIYHNFKSQIIQAEYRGYDRYDGPVKVIFGGDSEYTSKDIAPAFNHVFEHFDEENDLVTINDAGHWVHYNQPKQFLKVISDFLSDMELKLKTA